MHSTPSPKSNFSPQNNSLKKYEDSSNALPQAESRVCKEPVMYDQQPVTHKHLGTAHAVTAGQPGVSASIPDAWDQGKKKPQNFMKVFDHWLHCIVYRQGSRC